MLNQNQTPLLDAIISNAKRPHAAFYTPGHKQGKGISSKLLEYFGKAVFRADLTELTELDCLFAPDGVIQQAQQLAAEAFGSTKTWFLVNGSTCGIEAAILATCSDGDKIILPRNIHSSVISGLILSGAIPIFINPEYDTNLNIAHSITVESLETALQKHPDAKAVMIVYPTYYGVCGNIKAIAQLTHEYNIPLLVDEAHGAHFAFHPQLPISALNAGADLSVQSIHKTLGAMTQASMLHLQGNRIDINRINKALQLTQSTSPSYLLLASLDAARQQIALNGKELLTQTLQLAQQARNRINKIPGLSTLSSPSSPSSPSIDNTRFTAIVSELGITGFEAEEILDEKFNVTPEFASLKTVTFIISLGNTAEDIEKLVKAFITLAKEYKKPLLAIEKGFDCKNLPIFNNQEAEPLKLGSQPESGNQNQPEAGNQNEPEAGNQNEPESGNQNEPEAGNENELESGNQDEPEAGNQNLALSPRQAFFSSTETVSIHQAINRISAETVSPYPPGIPLLIPGEKITSAVVEHLLNVKACGGFITNCADTSLCTLKVVKDGHGG